MTWSRVLGAGVVVALAWVLVRPAAPPLFDGLGFPDAPYVYVTPPAGHASTPPSSGVTSSDLASKIAFLVQTPENGPQAEYDIPRSALQTTPEATSVTLQLTPEAPVDIPGGKVWGNVYRLSVTTDKGTAKIVKSKDGGFVQLRAPQAPPPSPVIEYNDGSGWRELTTTRSGNDIFSAASEAAGEYALVLKSAGTPAARSTSSGSTIGIVLIILGGLAATFVMVVRIRRKRAGTPTRPN